DILVTFLSFSSIIAVSFSANPPIVCDKANGWDNFGSSCYKVKDNTKTWLSSRRDCINEGGDLVSIESPSENQYVILVKLNFNLFNNSFLATSDVWTGLNDLEISNYFTWSSSDIVRFTYWDSGEPNNHNGENCVEMGITANGSSYWNDLNCDAMRDWICQIPKETWLR
uniref:C-type lectin domain-containing protein n=1 Tax=Erpetoichthys calabaricus TaxID=27687 RepID=A0A8C4SLW9_ERPCA